MTSSFKPETTQSSFSRPSAPVVSMNIPKVNGFIAKFFYNYYMPDERTNESPSIPDYLKRKSIEQVNTEVVDFSLRVPRYIKLQWESPAGMIAPPGPLLANSPAASIRSNLDKIQTEESFLKSKFSSHSISSYSSITDANAEIMSIGGSLYPGLDASLSEINDGSTNDPLEQQSLAASNSTQTSLIKSQLPTSIVNYDSPSSKSSFIIPKVSSQKESIMPLPNSLPGIRKQQQYTLPNDTLKDVGFSLSKLVDTYNQNGIQGFTVAMQTQKGASSEKDKFNSVSSAVKNIEDIATNPFKSLGIAFYDKNNSQINVDLGYKSLKDKINKNPLHVQINKLTSIDIFASSSIITSKDLKNINLGYRQANKESAELDDVFAHPTYVGPVVQTPDSFESSAGLAGYLIERSVYTNGGFEKDKTYTIENAYVTDFVDTSVLFGKEYFYSIRSIVRVSTTGYDEETNEIREIQYFIGSRSIDTTIKTFEFVPPPQPVDLNFIWDYKNKKLQITWGMPVNSQRDITQFQVFRREKIEEPFELISQKCFDNSKLKYRTGEIIDGNLKSTSSENLQFVQYSDQPVMFHIDDDFKSDFVNLKSSKFIYTIASIDAHGMSSNYGAQFEVVFDFFKNALVKKLISSPGAPKPYPNLYVKIDAFKDVIKTSGINSTKLKIYFMPEYFKVSYSNGRIQRMVTTKQDNAYYKIQFINLQNQKGDSLKINIDDPHELTK